MAPLRFPWLWWGLGWLLVAGIVFGSLLPGNVVPTAALNDKLVHAASYCVLMLWFSGLVSRERNLLVVATLTFLLGLLLDVLQGTVSSRRTFDLLDVAANAGGILVGLVIARLLLAGWCARIERLFPV